MDTKGKIQHRPHHKPCAASALSASPGYVPFECDGQWGVAHHDALEYEAIFDESTARLMVQLLNEGKGLDAWEEMDEYDREELGREPDFLRDRLVEVGWVDPLLSHNDQGHTQTGAPNE